MLAAILYPAVRVMHQPVPGRQVLQSHFQCGERTFHAQVSGQIPAHYLMGIHIGQQAQIDECAVTQPYVRDVSYPNLARTIRNAPFP